MAQWKHATCLIPFPFGHIEGVTAKFTFTPQHLLLLMCIQPFAFRLQQRYCVNSPGAGLCFLNTVLLTTTATHVVQVLNVERPLKKISQVKHFVSIVESCSIQ